MENTNETKWPIFRLNDCEWWCAPDLGTAIQQAMGDTGLPRDEVVDGGERQLTEEELNNLPFLDEGYRDPKKMSPMEVFDSVSDWICECGHVGDLYCRWNGYLFEHHHGYPVGHVPMRNKFKRTFREERDRQMERGWDRPFLLATTEF